MGASSSTTCIRNWVLVAAQRARPNRQPRARPDGLRTPPRFLDGSVWKSGRARRCEKQASEPEPEGTARLTDAKRVSRVSRIGYSGYPVRDCGATSGIAGPLQGIAGESSATEPFGREGRHETLRQGIRLICFPTPGSTSVVARARYAECY